MGQRKQVNLTIHGKEGDEIVQAAATEDLPVATFCRKLLRLAMLQYKTAGSLHAMRSQKPKKG